MKRVIRLHFKPILCENYNVWKLQCNNLTHGNCNNLPHGGGFTRNTCASKTLAPKAVLIPPIYTTGRYRYTSFPKCVNFQLNLDIFGARWIFENVTNLLGEVKNLFFSHNFFSLPSIISKFRMQSWFEILCIRHNSQLLLSSSFWENATVTTRPGGYFIELVIHWLLPWQQSMTVLHSQSNQECHFICQWMTSSMKYIILS